MNISWTSIIVGFGVVAASGFVLFAIAACRVAGEYDKKLDKYMETWGTQSKVPRPPTEP